MFLSKELLLLVFFTGTETVASFSAFQFPSIPTFFKPPNSAAVTADPVSKKKAELLEAISYTNNGKDASPETQAKVLQIVREIETTSPTRDTLFTDPVEAAKLDGLWYLQYTSPSVVGDDDEFPDAWKPVVAESNIETKQFNGKGEVSASGIRVDTSNKVVKQIFDVTKMTATNLITLDFGKVCVSGTFRPSKNVPTRAVVSFTNADITLNNGLELKLGFLFSVLALFRGKENGWLETTYLGDDMRIGRGNKGTMFVLTRDVDAVQP
eukprot:scaffold45325_cov64-Attheya_sp.AAC.1